MKQDSYNSRIGLPEMGDFYYDAPDQTSFFGNMGNNINPTKSNDKTSSAAKFKFYEEDPPQAGYDSTKETVTFNIDLKEKGISDDSETVAGIKVDDGDTIKIPLSQVKCSDDGSQKYIDSMKAYTAEHDQNNDATSLTIRFAGMDCKELPHYRKVDRSSVNEKFVYATYADASKNSNYVVSKYKSFMQTRKTIDTTYDGSDVNGNTFFEYASTYGNDEKLTFIKLEDDKYHQIFDDGTNAYILQKSDCNNYKPKTIADAGVARDVVANAINSAEDMRVVVDCTKITRDGSPITTMFRYNALNDDWSNSVYRKTLDSLLDSYTQYPRAGFNYWGQDAYGRCISAVYVKIKGKWVNLNKMVIVDTNLTDVNKYNQAEDSSSGIDTSTYDYKNMKYADAMYANTLHFDDRPAVHAELFYALGKESAWATLKDWTVIIGDVVLIVPPTAIRVLNQTKADRLPVVRAKGALAKSATKVQRVIEMDLYFNEDRGINGIEYQTNTHPDGSGVDITYYMNGLRALYSEFRLAPFLPIDNNYINMALGIDAVSMINFSCETVPNFPKLIKVTLQLAEFEYRIYMPEIPYDPGDDDDKVIRNYFSEQINYPLFRYYYQRPLINGQKLKDVDFTSDKFIESTLGNKTNLIPASFISSGIKFYIPNRDNLEKLKQAKISRLTRPNTVRNITASELNFASEMAKLDNEIQYLKSAEDSPLNALNSVLQSSEFEGCKLKYISADSSGNTVFKIYNSEGKLDEKRTEAVRSALANVADGYDESFSQIKKNDGTPLCPKQGATAPDITFDGDNMKVGVTLSEQVNVPEISDDDLKSLKTLATVSGKYSGNEVFVNRKINLKISMYGDKNGIELGKSDTTYFSLDETNDLDFLKFCSAVSEQQGVGGNEEANNAKAIIDYVDKNTIKWVPYNDDEEFIVESFNMNTSNSFSQITLQETNGYAPQYMGGTDVTINISMYTHNFTTASAMSSLPGMAAQYAREYKLVLAAWPLRVESEITKLFGITEVMIEAVEIDTVPNYPSLYRVNMTLVSVDRTLRNREALKKKDLQNFHNLSIQGVSQERCWSYNQISKFLSSAELYPDLELPTLEELSKAGYNFIHYSNEDRVYPDPDFYFTYSYVLMSQLIREAVLNSLNNGGSMTVGDSTGKTATGLINTAMTAWENFPWIREKTREISEFKKAKETYKTDDAVMARVITDFINPKDDKRDEVWTIAPNVKVALMEKRIANKVNDSAKQEYQESNGVTTANNSTYNNSNSGNSNPTGTADAKSAQNQAEVSVIYGQDGSVEVSKNNSSGSETKNTTKTTNTDAQTTVSVKSSTLDKSGTNDSKTDTTKTKEKTGTASESTKNKTENSSGDNSSGDNNSSGDGSASGDSSDSSSKNKKSDAEKAAEEKEQHYTSFVKDKNDELYQKVCEYVDTYLKTGINTAVTSDASATLNGLFKRFSSYGEMSEEFLDGVTLASVDADKWLYAAADAICSEGGVEYSDKYSMLNTIKDTVVNVAQGTTDTSNLTPSNVVADAASGALNAAGTVASAAGTVVGTVAGAAAGTLSGVATGGIGTAVTVAGGAIAGGKGGNAIGNAIGNDLKKIGNIIDESSNSPNAPWRYSKRCRAKVAAGNIIKTITFSKQDSEYDSKIALVKCSAVEFGYFNFRFYSAEELEDKFGYYGSVEGVPQTSIRYGAYLADPYYRTASYEEQCEYIEKCTTDFSYAKQAFLRICMLYMKTLMSYNVLPSFAYDIMADAIYQEDVIKRVKQSVEAKEKEEAELENAKAQQQKGYGITKKYTQNGDSSTTAKVSKDGKNQATETKNKSDDNSGSSGSTTDNSSGNGSSDNNNNNNGNSGGSTETTKENGEETGDSSNTSASSEALDSTVSQFKASFKENKQAIDRGKIFLILAAGVVDGDKEFMKTLRNHDYDALNAISSGATTSAKTIQAEDAGQYKNQLRRFIRAMAGEKIIEADDIGTGGKTQTPQNIMAEENARINVAAASENPNLYLIHSFYDMIVHDCRGRMLRAFPTFYMFLVDEGRKIGRWKLHDNFYNVNSISSITISSSRKMPIDTAEVIMSNFYNTYTTDDEDLNAGYTTNFTDVFNSLWLPTQTSYAVSEEEKRTSALSVERFRLRPGARIYIRLGYGSDASHLPPSFNGTIAELETGDTIKLICQSDGGELCKPIALDGVQFASDLQNVDQFCGPIGENGDSPKHILRCLLGMKGGFINSMMHDANMDDAANLFGEPINPLGIYHFGNPDIKYGGDAETVQNIFDVGLQDSSVRYAGTEDTGKKSSASEKLDTIGDALLAGGGTASLTGVGIPAAVGLAAAGAVAKGIAYAMDSVNPEEATNIQFEVDNKSVWDVANICKSVEPEYYLAVLPFHMRSTLFMGRSHDYVAYDYCTIDGTMIEKRKPFQQCHIYTSFTDIINNSIAVSTKDIKTCAVGMYEVEGTFGTRVPKKTDAQWVDRNIYPEYQQTAYVDTKLYGQPSRTLGVLSDVANWFSAGITNDMFDRAADDKGRARNHHSTAVKMTINALKDGMKEMYQGQFTIIGDPAVKPQDRIIINDTYNCITGQCLVRNVVQVFSPDDGYKTVITPDLITAQVGDSAQGELRRTCMGHIANTACSVIGTLVAFKLGKKATSSVTKMMSWASETKAAEIASKKKAAVKAAANAKASDTFETLLKDHKKTKAFFKQAGSAISGAGELSTTLLKTGASIVSKLAGPLTAVAGTAILGCAEDMLMSAITSRKRLVVFPLQKYNRPMVGGLDGNVGSVYGSPNFDTSDGFQQMFGGILESTPLKVIASVLYGDNGVYQLAQAAGLSAEEKTANLEGTYQQVVTDVNKSDLNTITKTHYNPAISRMDVRKKTDRKKALETYGVVGNTESTINSDPNMSKMVAVIKDKVLQPYLDLGFFRIVGHEKGFTSDVSDKIVCFNINNPDGSGSIPVNALKYDNGSYDIPFLNKNAIGVLDDIAINSLKFLSGAEQTRDPMKWYTDNCNSFITLTSALKCGSKDGYESTGFSFILTASDDKSRVATQQAVEYLINNQKTSSEKNSTIKEKSFESSNDGNNIKILVYPPATGE